jgi:hypothetical protein
MPPKPLSPLRPPPPGLLSLNHVWRPLVEKAGYKIEDIPKTWDAFYDFFKGVQKKLRESAAASRTRRNSLTPTGSTSSTLRSASAYLAACAIARTAAAGLFRRSNTGLHSIR